MKPFLSIIIPTYNRKKLVCQTIDSALASFSNYTDVEIIVVDDASEDGTDAHLFLTYDTDILQQIMHIIRCEQNQGVTAAKNLGADFAQGEWLLFLDSDDLLVPDTGETVMSALHSAKDCHLVFFRSCVLETGALIGPEMGSDIGSDRGASYCLNLRDYINNGTPGECLPAVRAETFRMFPYDASLRGCEGLAYAEIIRASGPAKVENIVVRQYRTSNTDRLCMRKHIRQRSCLLFRYHGLFLKRFLRFMHVKTIIMTMIKIIYYGIICLVDLWGRND